MPTHERTLARGYDRGFDFVARGKAALSRTIPSQHQQALGLDAGFIPKSGKHTYGLERFWNGTQGRAQRGLEISLPAWLDIRWRGGSITASSITSSGAATCGGSACSIALAAARPCSSVAIRTCRHGASIAITRRVSKACPGSGPGQALIQG